MTKEEKQLLLKDLCGRLPYGVKCKDWAYDENDREIDTIEELEVIYPKSMKYMYSGIHAEHNIERIKPYLRPMSSMTENEYKEYDKACELDCDISSNTLKTNIKAKKRVLISAWYHGIDWLNEHHFDYRRLIPRGLALKAPEGMYDR